MALYLSKTFRKLASGKKLVYFTLRANIWDYAEKRQKTKYVAYVGRKPQLPLEKARKLAKQLRIDLEDLKRVRGLKLIERDDP